jgi:hypothetical protein
MYSYHVYYSIYYNSRLTQHKGRDVQVIDVRIRPRERQRIDGCIKVGQFIVSELVTGLVSLDRISFN